MSDATLELDTSRRKFLRTTTIAAGCVAAAGAAVPFVASMLPSEKTRGAGAPVEVDVSEVAPATLVTVVWRGKPVWILHRNTEMLDLLGKNDAQLRDPQSEKSQQPKYARNPTRAIKPEYFVAIAICTHLGCIPTYRKEVGAADLGRDWPGGFFCSCHGSRFDLAGRVFRNVPAPINLEIPRHAYLSETRLLIGEDQG